jgi:hypothetical protein
MEILLFVFFHDNFLFAAVSNCVTCWSAGISSPVLNLSRWTSASCGCSVRWLTARFASSYFVCINFLADENGDNQENDKTEEFHLVTLLNARLKLKSQMRGMEAMIPIFQIVTNRPEK